jgi:periplasmic protein TonB
MFEHYLVQHAPDRRRRLRLMVAAHLAAFATTGALGFTWLMGKLHIAQVAPPNANFVLVQMSLDTPLPPPPLPPAPARTEPEDRAVPDEPEPDDEPPETFTELLPPPKPRPGPVGNGPPTATGTAPIGVPGVGVGIPGVNRLVTGFNPGLATARQPKAEQRAPVPLTAVHAQAVYTPNPDKDRLAATRAGMFDKRPGENETSFCVDATGRTTEIRTVKAFPGDPAVDEVIRSTIKTWRFRPFMVEGKAIKTCTSQTFRISFK